MHKKHETRGCLPSIVFASFKNKKKKRKKKERRYILGWELGAMSKGQKSWVHPSHQPQGIQNHISC